MKYIEPPKKLTLKQMNLIYGGKKVNCGGLTYCLFLMKCVIRLEEFMVNV